MQKWFRKFIDIKLGTCTGTSGRLCNESRDRPPVALPIPKHRQTECLPDGECQVVWQVLLVQDPIRESTHDHESVILLLRLTSLQCTMVFRNPKWVTSSVCISKQGKQVAPDSLSFCTAYASCCSTSVRNGNGEQLPA